MLYLLVLYRQLLEQVTGVENLELDGHERLNENTLAKAPGVGQ